MGFGYDLEAAKTKMPAAIEVTETFVNQRCPQVKEIVMDNAKAVNADKLTKICTSFCDLVDAMAKLLGAVLGSEGDSVTEGTLHGALASVKKMDTAVNG